MKLTLAVLPGDGIGPEVMRETLNVLRALDLDIETREGLVGGISMDTHGVALTDETLQLAQNADAVLFGAVGGPPNSPWSNPNNKVRPEQAILGLRKGLELFANLRPVKVYDALIDASTLKPEVVRGVDMLILRELTGGCYFGKPQEIRGSAPNQEAVDTTFYTEAEVRRLMTMAFELARGRRKYVVQADKANVMATGRLWRRVANAVAKSYPDVKYEDVLADALSMHLLRNPRAYDVIATENLFGDILSDEAAMIAGSMGMMPSASLGDQRNKHGFRRGLYEPIHGSAPDIAGEGIANPIAMVLSAAMMLRWSFGLSAQAERIERAVERVLADGIRSMDLKALGGKVVGTREMGQAIVERL